MSPKTTRFENLLEAVPDALVGMDQQGQIRFVNRQTESLFGYDRDQLIGQPIEILLPEPLWQIYAEHRDNYFADPRTRSSGLELELSGRQQDGTEFPINISLSHIDTGDVLLVITAVGEVSQRKQAVKNAELIASLVEYSDDAILGTTFGGFITSWNPAAERMYGYSGKEIIGKSVTLLSPKDRPGEAKAVLTKISAGQHVEHLETIRVRKDGTLVPVSITIAPIHDEDGAIVGVSAVHRDVTKQRQALAIAQRMAAIVEGSDDAVISSTLEGIITSWNPAAERLFGYSSEEIIGTPGAAVSPKDRPEEINEILTKIIAGQHIEHLETKRVRKDATVIPVTLTVSPIRDADGAIVGASMISRDMTELKHAAEYSRSLIEAGLDPLVTISPEGKIDDVNQAAVKATGVPRDLLIGTDFSYYFTDPDKALQGYERAFAQGSVTDYPLTLRHRDGTLTDVLYNASVYRDFNGRVLGVLAVARDVTEQKKATALAQRMEAIVRYSQDAIISGGLDDTITSWNPAAERILGYSSDEIIGKSADVLIPEDRAGEVKAIGAKVRAGEPVEHLETTQVRKDGTVIPVSLTVSPILDEEGTIVGASTIARDVSAQRQAFQAAQRMTAIVENSDDAIISGLLDGTVTSWNPAAERMYGYSSAEVIGKPADFLTPTDRAGEINAILEKVRAGRHVEHLETKRVRKNGTVFPVSLTVSPIRDADGGVVGTSVIHRDLTEQKGALASAQRMAAIVEYSDDAIIGRTLDGTVTSWNRAAERMFGYSSAEIVGQPIDLLSPKDRAGETISLLAKISAGRPVEHLETKRVRKDGTVITVSLTISPICDEDGTVVGASVICRDVTELKQAAMYTRSLIEAALDPLVTISPEGKITDVNEATVRATGVPRDKLLGTDFSHYFTNPDKAHQGYRRTFAAGSVTDYPLTLRHRDGTLTDVLYNASVYRDTRGNVLGVFAAARDMTKQKEAFEAAERMRAVVEHSDDAIIGTSLDGIITSWNPAAERMYGYPGEKIVRRSVDVLSPKDRAGEIKAILAMISEGRPVGNFETICTRKDRTTFPVKLTVAPIRDTDGAVVGASAIARDVTKQRQALADARQMAAIVQNTDDAIIGRNLDGIITSWNPAAERMFGHCSEEMVGKTIELLTPEDRAGEAKAVLAKISAGALVEHLETLRVRKDGTLIPVSLTVSPIRDTDGTVVGASVIARQMPDQK
jgi:PAS domain S-box-containing protein